MTNAEWIEKNWDRLVKLTKNNTHLWREALSELSIHLIEREGKLVPDMKFCYWYVNLITQKNGVLNYQPKTLREGIEGLEEDLDDEVRRIKMVIDIPPIDEEKRIQMEIDVPNEELRDFLMNNPNNKKWIRIWEIVYHKKIEMDLFESLLFDYIFVKGLTIRQIAHITSMSNSWISRKRKSLIDKIKRNIDNG